MDLNRTARDEIACEETGRRSENFESAEANDWCDYGQSAPAWYLAVHASLMLPTGPRNESFILSRSGFDGSDVSPRQAILTTSSRCAADPCLLYTACMHRDTKELLIGWSATLLFGVALVAWPSLGFYIHGVVHVPLDFILGLF
jgi:hypothetical protein